METSRLFLCSEISTFALRGTPSRRLPVSCTLLNSLKSLSSSPRRPLSKTCAPRDSFNLSGPCKFTSSSNTLLSLRSPTFSLFRLSSMSSSTEVSPCNVPSSVTLKTVRRTVWSPLTLRGSANRSRQLQRRRSTIRRRWSPRRSSISHQRSQLPQGSKD